MPGNLDLALRIRADLGNAKRNLDQLERDLRQVGRAGRTAGRQAGGAARNIDRTGEASRRAARQARDASGRFRRMGRDLGGLELSADRAARRLSGLYLALGGIGGAAAVRRLVDAGLEIERLEQRFNFAAGSIAAGGRELAFVRQEADRLGISFAAAAQGYSSLLAAARGTPLEADSREIFLSIAEAGAVLRLSADEVQGALTAVEQIISKGKVSAEELRGQLGERLPGAFLIAARAMGVTTQELDKMLEQGQLLATDFLPRFARQLREEFREGVPAAADSASASFERLGNSIERLEQAVAKSGLLEFLAEVADRTTDAVDGVRTLRREFLAARAGIELAPEEAAFAQEFEALAKADPSAARQRLEELTFEAVEAISKVADLRAQLEAIKEGRIVGRGVLIGLTAQLEAAEAEVERFRNRISTGEALLRPPSATTPAPDRGDDADAEARKKAEERANAQLLQLRRQYWDQIVRVGADAIEREERARVEALRRVDELEAAGGDPERAADARAAIELRRSRRISAIRQRELEDFLKAENRKRAAIEETHEATLRSLEGAEAALAGPYAQAIHEARRWRDETLDALDETADGYDELAARVEKVYRERIAKAAEEATKRQADAFERLRDLVSKDLESIAAEGTATNDILTEGIVSAARAGEDAWVQFARTGKFEFSSFIDSVVADLARVAYQRAILGPIVDSIFGGGPSLSSGIRSFLSHSGGIAGQGARRTRAVDPRVFAGARRYHGGGFPGLRPDEVPTILRKGEGVFTPEQMAAIGNLGGGPRVIRVQIESRGTPQDVVDASAVFDPAEGVVNIVVDDLESGGPIARTIERIVPGAQL